MSDKTIEDVISEAAQPVYQKNDSDIIYYCGSMWFPSDDELIDTLALRRLRKNLLLIVTTTGGSVNTGYRI